MDDLFLPLFSSDLARDVRAEFDEKRRYGLSVDDATAAVISAFSELMQRPDEGPVVIVALAVLQLRERCLHQGVRDAALELLEARHGWESRPGESPAVQRERQSLRQAIIAALESADTIPARFED